MNIFSVGDGKEYELTRENFIEKTHKAFPFYQIPDDIKLHILRFALLAIIQFKL